MKKFIYIALVLVTSNSCKVDEIGTLIDPAIDVIYFEEDGTQVLENASTPVSILINSIKSGNSTTITLGGTAVKDVDYTISNDDLNPTFEQGVYSSAISLSIINNNVTDGDRTIVLSLPSGQGFGEDSKREFTIDLLDDDAPFGTVIAAIDSESDDAEEGITGSFPGDMDLGSSDLEFGEIEGSTRGVQLVGLRFNNLVIPKGVNIESATIQFTVDEDVDNPAPVIMEIYAESVDNASTFTEDDFNMSSRPLTTAMVEWDIPVWTTVGDAGPAQRTVNIAPVIKEVIDRPDWEAGNSINIIFVPNAATLSNPRDSGRVAEDGDDDKGAVITINWAR